MPMLPASWTQHGISRTEDHYPVFTTTEPPLKAPLSQNGLIAMQI